MTMIEDARLRELVDEFCQRIKTRYSEAEFRVYRRNGDPTEIFIDAYTNREDDWTVLDTVAERAMDVLVEEDYYLHVIPMPLSSLDDQTAAWRRPNYVVGQQPG